MENQEMHHKHRKIRELLLGSNLFQALHEIRIWAQGAEQFDIADKAKELLDNYSYMLDFLKSGGSDPHREQRRAQLYEEALVLNDRLSDTIQETQSASLYYSWRKRCRTWAESLQTDNLIQSLQMILIDRYEEEKRGELRGHSSLKNPSIPVDCNHFNSEDCANALFYAIWTDFDLNEEKSILVKQLITSDYIATHHRLLFVAALYLNAAHWYSHSKHLLHFDCLEAIDRRHSKAEEMVSARLLTGMVLLLFTHSAHFFLSTEPEIRLLSWAKSEPEEYPSPFLFYIQKQIYEALEANRPDNTGLGEAFVALLQKVKGDAKVDMASPETLDLMDEQGEWAKLPEFKRLKEKAKRMRQLRVRGVDVMFDTFAGACGSTFFRPMHTWFLPFSVEHLWLRKEFEADKSHVQFARVVEEAESFRDSDKYLFFDIFKGLPKEQFEQLRSNLLLGKELSESESTQQKTSWWKAETRNYIQALYRYHELYRNRDSVGSPFLSPDAFIKPKLDFYFNNYSLLTQLGDYLYETERYQTAHIAYKKGYEWCEEIKYLKRSAEAHHRYALSCGLRSLHEKTLEILRQCNENEPSDPQTLKLMAEILMHLERHTEACEVMEQILEQTPNDTELLRMLAESFLAEGDTAHATTQATRADLIQEGDAATQRLIIKCHLRSNDLCRASEYAELRLANRPTTEDFFLIGTLEALKGNISSSVAHYKRCLQNGENFSLGDLLHSIDHELQKHHWGERSISIETARELVIYDIMREQYKD